MDPLQVDIRLPRRDFVVDLTISLGRETLALVGPSGSGKTSVLRTIAGLERPATAHVILNGRPLTDTDHRVDVPVESRRIGYVFQDYALFPHLDVRHNIAFGARGAVDDLMDRFRIAHLSAARPSRLSGGERQRVALARALACDPELLLLEPLSALDAQTRPIVASELAKLVRGLDIPVIMVTHDFLEAALLADRVGVMDRGELKQIGTAHELLTHPADGFIASFTGANVLPGTASPDTGTDLTLVVLEDGTRIHSTDRASGPVDVIVYPWEIALDSAPPGGSMLNSVTGTVMSVVSVANRVRVQVGPLIAEITAASAEAMDIRVGRTMTASFKAAGTRVNARTPGGRAVTGPPV